MVGGPADVVVENDVRKVRGPGAPPAKIPGFETEKRAPSMTPPAPARTFDTPVAAAPKTPEPRRPAADARPTCDADARASCPAAARTRRRAKRRSAHLFAFGGNAKPGASTQRPATARPAGRRRSDAASPRAGRTEPAAAEPHPFRRRAATGTAGEGRTDAPSRARLCRPHRSPGPIPIRSRTRSCGRSASTRRRAAEHRHRAGASLRRKARDGFFRHPRRSRRPAGGGAGARDAVSRTSAEGRPDPGRLFIRC